MRYSPVPDQSFRVPDQVLVCLLSLMLELSDLAVCLEISRRQRHFRAWLMHFFYCTTYKAPFVQVKRNSFSLRTDGAGDASETPRRQVYELACLNQEAVDVNCLMEMLLLSEGMACRIVTGFIRTSYLRIQRIAFPAPQAHFPLLP